MSMNPCLNFSRRFLAYVFHIFAKHGLPFISRLCLFNLQLQFILQSHESHLGTEKNDSEMSFDEMNLKEALWSRLYSYGFKMPTKIQQRVLMPLIQGQNLRVQAKSEPGQVATYCSAIVQLFNYGKDDYTKYLILGCDMYHIAMVAALLSDLAAGLPPLDVWDLSKPKPRSDLFEVIQVIVGTPHQVWSQVQKGNISLTKISLVIVDEADSYINMVQEMRNISRALPREFQFAVFSETLLGETMSTLLLDCLEPSANFVEIVMEKEPVTPFDDMCHYAVTLGIDGRKMQLLSSIFDNWREDLQCVVFVKDFYWADHILLQLRNKANVKAWGIRGEMDQEYRDRVMKDYREGSINVLILTPYEACGFDVKVPKMINFELEPFTLNEYRKQIASFGTKGSVVTFVHPNDDLLALLSAGVHLRVVNSYNDWPRLLNLLFGVVETGRERLAE